MKRANFRILLVAAGLAVAGSFTAVAGWLVRGRAMRSSSLAGQGALEPKRYQPRHQWRSVRGRHWQIISTELEDRAATDAREGTRGQCPVGMVEVKGNMRQEIEQNPYEEGRIEYAQLKTCTEWIQKEYPERCAKFDGAEWRRIVARYPTKPMHFCMDRFEYPNLKGQYPIIFISWYEAKEMCEEQGKRLCDEDEWTFACEGEEAKPYPYGDGYTRDPDKCVTDQLWTPYNERPMQVRDSDAAGLEMDRLWRGKASGTQGACRSELGVYDLTGNVDEWTTSVRPGDRPSILKGGYWGPVRTRCRPTTRGHDQNHMFYQQGFRCCSSLGAAAPREGTSDPSVSPLPQELR